MTVVIFQFKSIQFNLFFIFLWWKYKWNNTCIYKVHIWIQSQIWIVHYIIQTLNINTNGHNIRRYTYRKTREIWWDLHKCKLDKLQVPELEGCRKYGERVKLHDQIKTRNLIQGMERIISKHENRRETSYQRSASFCWSWRRKWDEYANEEIIFWRAYNMEVARKQATSQIQYVIDRDLRGWAEKFKVWLWCNGRIWPNVIYLST